MKVIDKNKVNFFGKKCGSKEVYKNYFTIINGLLRLTNKEIEIVSMLYYYDEVISESVPDPKLRGLLLFSKEYKTKIVKELGIKSLLFNNYISSLKNKSIILVDDKEGANFKWLNPKFLLKRDGDNIDVIFRLKVIEEDEVPQEQPKPKKKKGRKEEKEIIPEEQFPEQTIGEEPEFDPNDPWGTDAA